MHSWQANIIPVGLAHGYVSTPFFGKIFIAKSLVSFLLKKPWWMWPQERALRYCGFTLSKSHAHCLGRLGKVRLYVGLREIFSKMLPGWKVRLFFLHRNNGLSVSSWAGIFQHLNCMALMRCWAASCNRAACGELILKIYDASFGLSLVHFLNHDADYQGNCF